MVLYDMYAPSAVELLLSWVFVWLFGDKPHRILLKNVFRIHRVPCLPLMKSKSVLGFNFKPRLYHKMQQMT